jgi:hypothetical protein
VNDLTQILERVDKGESEAAAELLNNELVLSWTNAGFNLQSAPGEGIRPTTSIVFQGNL